MVPRVVPEARPPVHNVGAARDPALAETRPVRVYIGVKTAPGPLAAGSGANSADPNRCAAGFGSGEPRGWERADPLDRRGAPRFRGHRRAQPTMRGALTIGTNLRPCATSIARASRSAIGLTGD